MRTCRSLALVAAGALLAAVTAGGSSTPPPTLKTTPPAQAWAGPSFPSTAAPACLHADPKGHVSEIETSLGSFATNTTELELTGENISNRMLQGLNPIGAPMLNGLTALTHLNLRQNQIDSLDHGLFRCLTALTRLEVGINHIASLDKRAFQGLTALTVLSLEANQITRLHDGVFGNLPALTYLSLNYNQITCLPQGVFGSLSAVAHLQLGGNRLTFLDRTVLRGLKALTKLDVHDNRLSDLPETVFQNFTALCVLLLYENHIAFHVTSRFFRDLTALLSLHMKNNQIALLPNGVFGNLTALNTLDMSNNQIALLPDGVFGNLTALTRLVLNANQITRLPDGVFRNLVNLAALKLNNNRVISMPVQLVPQKAGKTLLRSGSAMVSGDSINGFGMAGSSGLQNCQLGNAENTGAVTCDPECLYSSSKTAILDALGRLGCEPFRLSRDLPANCDGDTGELGDLWRRAAHLPAVFFVNETIKITGFSDDCNQSVLFDRIFDNDPSQLSYAVAFEDENGHRKPPPSGSSPVINAESGAVWIIPDPAATEQTYFASLVAQDTSGNTVQLANWNFTVKFNLEGGLRHNRGSSAEQVRQRGSATEPLGWATRTKWAIGTDYSLAQINRSGFAYNGVPREVSDPDLTFMLNPTPEGFGINSVTGAIHGTPTEQQNRTSTVYAVLLNEGGGHTTLALANITFDIRFPDTDDASHGPGGKGCSHGASEDDVEFDLSFTCDCTNTAFQGENCDSDRHTSKLSTKAVIMICVLSFVSLISGTAAWWARRKAHADANDDVPLMSMAALAAENPRWTFGLSIHHLVNVVLEHCPLVMEAQLARSNRSGVDFDGNPPEVWRPLITDAEAATVWHMVHGWAKPLTAAARCSYVEHVYATVDIGRDRHVGEATAMISYTWGDPYVKVMRALEAWSDGHGFDPTATRIWICSLCVDQYNLPQSLQATFGRRVEKIGMLLPLLVPWQHPRYITRLWCLFEYHTASTLGDCKVDIIFAPDDLSAMQSEGSTNIRRLEEMLESMDCKTADASFAADRDQIRRRIIKAGGFNLLNAVLREGLRKSFMASMMEQLHLLARRERALTAQLMDARGLPGIAGIPTSPSLESRVLATVFWPTEAAVLASTTAPSSGIAAATDADQQLTRIGRVRATRGNAVMETNVDGGLVH